MLSIFKFDAARTLDLQDKQIDFITQPDQRRRNPVKVLLLPDVMTRWVWDHGAAGVAPRDRTPFEVICKSPQIDLHQIVRAGIYRYGVAGAWRQTALQQRFIIACKKHLLIV